MRHNLPTTTGPQRLRACCCDGPCGAVSELERPSWLIAAPRTTTVLPGQLLSASAPTSCRSGLRPRVMQASPREYLRHQDSRQHTHRLQPDRSCRMLAVGRQTGCAVPAP